MYFFLRSHFGPKQSSIPSFFILCFAGGGSGKLICSSGGRLRTCPNQPTAWATNARCSFCLLIYPREITWMVPALLLFQGSWWSITLHETWTVYLNREGPIRVTTWHLISHPLDGTVGRPEACVWDAFISNTVGREWKLIWGNLERTKPSHASCTRPILGKCLLML